MVRGKTGLPSLVPSPEYMGRRGKRAEHKGRGKGVECMVKGKTGLPSLVPSPCTQGEG